jgi:hypothetical protein
MFDFNLLDKYEVHYVDYNDGGFINAHTHGIQENLGPMDFQIVAPLSAKDVSIIINRLVAKLVKGELFFPGMLYSGILVEDIMFMEAKEQGRIVLRMLYPDGSGIFPPDPGASQFLRAQTKFTT